MMKGRDRQTDVLPLLLLTMTWTPSATMSKFPPLPNRYIFSLNFRPLPLPSSTTQIVSLARRRRWP